MDMHRYTGNRESFNDQVFIQEELKPYVNVSTHGNSGHSDPIRISEFRNGTVKWIANSDDPVTSLENIHVTLYIKVNETITYESGSKWTMYDVYLSVYNDNFTLPTDILGRSEELLISQIGLSEPSHQFALNCTYYR